ncbi:YbjN domain-containing protein [Qipengyuania sp. GH38]|uniref:YbjN domain-containing protein n=1 Tax=Qipengyuania intermedia TaxID=2867244 RepID=UPI001C884B04|nr:YbjN domain-containing protein [Qipengyuania intermedia]MBX7512982.1 YbjN domain-containing protein [Qipengyuania intermedia]
MTQEQEISVPTLAELLSRLGYKAEEVERGVVRSSFSGTRILAQVYEPGSLQFVAGWSEFPSSFDLNDANEFNSNYRFGSVYLSDDNLTLQSNFLFDPAEDDAEGKLQLMVSLFEGLIRELLEMLREDGKQLVDADEGGGTTNS